MSRLAPFSISHLSFSIPPDSSSWLPGTRSSRTQERVLWSRPTRAVSSSRSRPPLTCNLPPPVLFSLSWRIRADRRSPSSQLLGIEGQSSSLRRVEAAPAHTPSLLRRSWSPSPASFSTTGSMISALRVSSFFPRPRLVALTTILAYLLLSQAARTRSAFSPRPPTTARPSIPFRPSFSPLLSLQISDPSFTVRPPVKGGKRPLSSMSPIVVDDPEGDFLFATSCAGGSRIITAQAQIVRNVIVSPLRSSSLSSSNSLLTLSPRSSRVLLPGLWHVCSFVALSPFRLLSPPDRLCGF